ncbi:MAG: hypothetical protein ACUVUG_03245 [Candidatus Aminicenantia bacterium]
MKKDLGNMRKTRGDKTFERVILRVLQFIDIIGLLTNFYRKYTPSKIILKLEEENIINGIPLEDNSIDLVIASPSYGDSRTNLAYG